MTPKTRRVAESLNLEAAAVIRRAERMAPRKADPATVRLEMVSGRAVPDTSVATAAPTPAPELTPMM